MIYAILTAHWIADFVLQTDQMAKNKSTSWKWLSSHVAVYSLALLPFGLKFAAINGAAHFFVDAVTSRASSYYWKKEKRHEFFVVIGLDQLIHILILIWSAQFVTVWGLL